MRAFTIENQRGFMTKLLTGEDFDDFLVRQITVTKEMTLVLEGDAAGGTCRPYGQVRGLVYDFIKGKQTPSYMKLVLLSPEHVEGVDSRSLNILFRDGLLGVTTGIAREGFSLDREPELAWDQEVERFLADHGILG